MHLTSVCGFAWSDMVHGCMVYTDRTRRDGSSFMWHQPCQRCKYTTSVENQWRAITEKLNHMQRSQSAREPRRLIALYKSDRQQQQQQHQQDICCAAFRPISESSPLPLTDTVLTKPETLNLKNILQSEPFPVLHLNCGSFPIIPREQHWKETFKKNTNITVHTEN